MTIGSRCPRCKTGRLDVHCPFDGCPPRLLRCQAHDCRTTFNLAARTAWELDGMAVRWDARWLTEPAS